MVNLLAVEGNRAAVEAMAARPDVLAIESDRAFRVPPETTEALGPQAATAVEWNLSWINAPAVWALGVTGQNAVYANADTGVQWTHPALKPHYRGWNGATADHNYSWWDAIHADIDGNGNPCGFNLAAPCDDQGHGTHTMGTGVGDDGTGTRSAWRRAPSGSPAATWTRMSDAPAPTSSACSSSFILEQTALHLTTTQGCGGDTSSQVPNNVYGYGRIDVLAAFNYAAAQDRRDAGARGA